MLIDESHPLRRRKDEVGARNLAEITEIGKAALFLLPFRFRTGISGNRPRRRQKSLSGPEEIRYRFRASSTRTAQALRAADDPAPCSAAGDPAPIARPRVSAISA
jgi:hypothetical protein